MTKEELEGENKRLEIEVAELKGNLELLKHATDNSILISVFVNHIQLLMNDIADSNQKYDELKKEHDRILNGIEEALNRTNDYFTSIPPTPNPA